MNLILDIGNTFMKFALFQEQTLLVKGKGDLSDLANFIAKKEIENCLISSVVFENKEELESLIAAPIIHLSHLTKIPVTNKYATKETLGDDRLANSVASAYLFPECNVLAIDGGTCIKYDFTSEKLSYLGGGISPGLQMRFQALAHFTGKLPLIHPIENVTLIGDSTATSVQSGVVRGTVAEIEGVIQQYRAIYENLTVILTGGDASFFDKELKSNIFVEPNLTLIGLNEILRYNTPD